MFTRLFLLVTLLLSTANVKADRWTLNDVLDATCRVNAGDGYGSGSCISNKDGYCYILTNSHVIGNNTTAKVEFFKNGKKTLPIPGNVVFNKRVEATEVDFAIIKVDARYFGKFPPKVAKLSVKGDVAYAGYIKSAGCPSARWPVAWEGFILSEEAKKILFYPPPIGGQSGSGIYVDVQRGDKFETVLKAMVTWRIGGGIVDKNEAQGYESYKGGGVLITTLNDILNGVAPTKLPANYIPVSTVYHGPITTFYRPCAYGSDGNFYLIGKNKWNEFYVSAPASVRIIAWGTDCPDGICPIQPYDDEPSPIAPLLPVPPRNEPPNNDSNPYDNLPDFDDTPPVAPPAPVVPDTKILDALKAENKELAAKITTLEAAKKQLLDDLAAKNLELTAAAEKINILQTQYDKASNDIRTTEAEKNGLVEKLNEAKQALVDKQVELSNAVAALSGVNQQLNATTTEALAAQEAAKKAAADAALTQNQITEVKSTNNILTWLSGILGTGFAGTILKLFYDWASSKKVGQTLENKLDPVEDKIQKQIEAVLGQPTGDSVRQAVEAAEQRLLDLFDKKLRDIVEKKNEVGVTKAELDDRTAHVLTESKIAQDSLSTQIEELTTKLDTEKAPAVYNNSTNVNIHHDGSLLQLQRPNNPNFNTYIDQLMALKKRDGENIGDWVLLGVLYKEAVEQLKQGGLLYRNKVTLQGQEVTAEKIEEWVQAEFVRRHGTDKIDLNDNSNVQAYMAMLYKEAVTALKTGQIKALGAQATAFEIEKWVNKQYALKLGMYSN